MKRLLLPAEQETLRLLSSAVLQSREAVVITDAQLDLPGPGILFVNPAFTRMTGYTAEEVIGKTPRILQGPRTDRAVLSRLRRNLERGEEFEGETINYRKDGTEFNLEWQIAPIRDAGGTVTHFVANQRDITERNRVEEELRRLRDQYALILNSLGEGVHGLGLDGRILFENAASASMLGYDIDDIIGRPAHETMHHTRSDGTPYPKTECPIYATLNGGPARHIRDELFWRKDGTSFPAEYTCAPLRDKEGGVIGSTVVFTDITERKRLEAQLFQSQKMETVGKLAGGVAHEFNSILTAIIGQSELLLADLPAGSPLGRKRGGNPQSRRNGPRP